MKAPALLALMAVITASSALANPYADALGKLDPLRRAAVLRRAMLDNGQRCGRVDEVGRVPPYRNLVGWHAHCTPGGDYLAFVGPDGTVQVSTCAEARQVRLPGCPPPRK